MPTRLRVFSAFLSLAVLCSLVPGTQAQSAENAREEHCGRTSCRELAQMLTTAVTAATDQFEASRSRLRPHEVYLKGPFSRFVAYVKQLLGLRNQKQENTRTIGSQSPTPVQINDSLSVYNAHEVERLLSSTKKTVIKNLEKNSDFMPLITYVQKEFPGAPPTIEIRGAGYVKEDSADSYFEKAKSFLRSLVAKGPGPVNLHFTSTPELGASIVLKVFKNYTRNTMTVGSIPGLVRGIYFYEVSRDGFKGGSGSLDLANENREQVECYLQRLTSSQTSTCVFK